MTAGKNKLLRYARCYFGGFDISGDARTFDSLEYGYGEQDMSGWSNQIRQMLADRVLQTGIRGFQALMNDATTSGAFTLLASPGGITPDVVTIAFGGGAPPAVGDIAYILDGVQMADPISLDGKAFVIKTDFLAPACGNPWGKVLMPSTAITASVEGTSDNNGASSANGYHANLHILASSGVGAEFNFYIEHSPDNSCWAALDTFTADGTAIGGEYKEGTGTVDQYVRFCVTLVSGTCTALCTFARK